MPAEFYHVNIYLFLCMFFFLKMFASNSFPTPSQLSQNATLPCLCTFPVSTRSSVVEKFLPDRFRWRQVCLLAGKKQWKCKHFPFVFRSISLSLCWFGHTKPAIRQEVPLTGEAADGKLNFPPAKTATAACKIFPGVEGLLEGGERGNFHTEIGMCRCAPLGVFPRFAVLEPSLIELSTFIQRSARATDSRTCRLDSVWRGPRRWRDIINELRFTV